MVNQEERQAVRQTYSGLNELATRKHRIELRIQMLQDEVQQLRKEHVEVSNQLNQGILKAQPTVVAPQKHAKSSKTEDTIRQALRDPEKVAQIMEILKAKGL